MGRLYVCFQKNPDECELFYCGKGSSARKAVRDAISACCDVDYFETWVAHVKAHSIPRRELRYNLETEQVVVTTEPIPADYEARRIEQYAREENCDDIPADWQPWRHWIQIEKPFSKIVIDYGKMVTIRIPLLLKRALEEEDPEIFSPESCASKCYLKDDEILKFKLRHGDL